MRRQTQHTGTGGRVVDPVCGMPVDPEAAAGSTVHDGSTFHFCSVHCLRMFEADPSTYLERG